MTGPDQRRPSGWVQLALALAMGALMTGGHPPVSVPWLMFGALPVLVWVLGRAPGARGAAMVGWAAGFGYFVTGLHWIGHAFLVDADQFGALIPLGVAGLPAGLALFWALAFWAVWRWGPGDRLGRAVALGLALTAVEYARAHVLTGFPWALPGYVWVDTPAMQAAAWIGPFGVTLLTLVLGAVFGSAVVERRFATAALCMAVGGAIWAGGTLRLETPAAYAPDAPVIRLVQPNAPQHQKWDPDYRDVFYRRLLDATAAPAEGGRPDLVLWPEMAVAFLPAERPDRRAEIAAAAGGAPVVLGAFHLTSPDAPGRVTNALFTVMPDGGIGARYDKHHLVPFGEYLPLSGLLGRLGLDVFGQSGGMVEGPGPATIAIPGLPAFGALICYEVIFPGEVAPGERPGWLVQLTNDAWFGAFAGPQQHYAQARIRAIEQGLPLARAANTGISGIVDPFGREIIYLGLSLSGHVDHKLPSALSATFYSRVGDAPAIIVFLMIFITYLIKRYFSQIH